jgi:rubrerythrin
MDILNNRREVIMKKSLAQAKPELLEEWDYDKNQGLDPHRIGSRSKTKASWKCPLGHSYKARVDHRVHENSGCPVCANRIVVYKKSLAYLRPELAREWHPFLNGDLQPNQVPPGSSQKVWWLCSECGREWEALISNRRREKGCSHPKQHDVTKESLGHLYPEVAQEWHPSKNLPLTPWDVPPNSSKKVVWQCKKCRHEWKTAVNHRTLSQSGCPKCKNRPSKKKLSSEHCLAVAFPNLAKEWDTERNAPNTPFDFTPGSGKKVNWICSQCSHSWKATIDNRRKRGCPMCARTISYPEAAIGYYLKKVFHDLIIHFRFLT